MVSTGASRVSIHERPAQVHDRVADRVEVRVQVAAVVGKVVAADQVRAELVRYIADKPSPTIGHGPFQRNLNQLREALEDKDPEVQRKACEELEEY